MAITQKGICGAKLKVFINQVFLGRQKERAIFLQVTVLAKYEGSKTDCVKAALKVTSYFEMYKGQSGRFCFWQTYL